MELGGGFQVDHLYVNLDYSDHLCVNLDYFDHLTASRKFQRRNRWGWSKSEKLWVILAGDFNSKIVINPSWGFQIILAQNFKTLCPPIAEEYGWLESTFGHPATLFRLNITLFKQLAQHWPIFEPFGTTLKTLFQSQAQHWTTVQSKNKKGNLHHSYRLNSPNLKIWQVLIRNQLNAMPISQFGLLMYAIFQRKPLARSNTMSLKNIQ